MFIGYIDPNELELIPSETSIISITGKRKLICYGNSPAEARDMFLDRVNDDNKELLTCYGEEFALTSYPSGDLQSHQIIIPFLDSQLAKLAYDKMKKEFQKATLLNREGDSVELRFITQDSRTEFIERLLYTVQEFL